MDRLVDFRRYRRRFRDLQTVEEAKRLKRPTRGVLLIYHGRGGGTLTFGLVSQKEFHAEGSLGDSWLTGLSVVLAKVKLGHCTGWTRTNLSMVPWKARRFKRRDG